MNNNVLKLEINNKTKHLEKYIKPQWTWKTYLFLISLIVALTFTIVGLEINFIELFSDHQNILEIYLIECYHRIFLI